MTEHCSPWRALLSTLTTLFVLVMLLPPAGTRADADFESVRIAYDYEERSGRHGDPKGKYWHESVFHPHYDGRFTDHVLLYNYQRTNLTALMQSYLFAMSDLGAKTWISHGTLLGWWWNREIMPWDTDIDVQMTARSVGFLARYYNLTVHAFGPKKYMLEINPGFTNTSYTDRLNVIDARWIDIQTGLFIDITAVRTKPGSRGKVMSSKDRHEEDTQDLFPLRDTIFEGVPAKVPYNYLKLLTDEYGMKSISKLSHMDHKFNKTSKEWIRQPSAFKAKGCMGSWRVCLIKQQEEDRRRQAEISEEKRRKGKDAKDDWQGVVRRRKQMWLSEKQKLKGNRRKGGEG